MIRNRIRPLHINRRLVLLFLFRLEDLPGRFNELVQDNGVRLPVYQADSPAHIQLQGYCPERLELVFDVGRDQAHMTVLKRTQHGVQIHNPGVFADPDVRIVLFDQFPEPRQAVKAVDDDMLPPQVVERQALPGGERMVGRHQAVPALPEQRLEKPAGGFETREYCYENGIIDYVKELAGDSPLTQPRFIQSERRGRDREDKEEILISL